MVQRSFLERSTTIAFAHRGGGGEAPENTLPAFEAAVALGYRYLETDVHLTRDGVLLAFHDSSLERLTDRAGRIGALSLDEVREADAGYGFSPDGGRTFPFRGTGVVVPTLEELLTRWDDVFINIDAKTDDTVIPLIALVDASMRSIACASDRSRTAGSPASDRWQADGSAHRWARSPLPWRTQRREPEGCRASTPTASRCRSAGAGCASTGGS